MNAVSADFAKSSVGILWLSTELQSVRQETLLVEVI